MLAGGLVTNSTGLTLYEHPQILYHSWQFKHFFRWHIFLRTWPGNHFFYLCTGERWPLFSCYTRWSRPGCRSRKEWSERRSFLLRRTQWRSRAGYWFRRERLIFRLWTLDLPSTMCIEKSSCSKFSQNSQIEIFPVFSNRFPLRTPLVTHFLLWIPLSNWWQKQIVIVLSRLW